MALNEGRNHMGHRVYNREESGSPWSVMLNYPAEVAAIPILPEADIQLEANPAGFSTDPAALAANGVANIVAERQ